MRKGNNVKKECSCAVPLLLLVMASILNILAKQNNKLVSFYNVTSNSFFVFLPSKNFLVTLSCNYMPKNSSLPTFIIIIIIII